MLRPYELRSALLSLLRGGLGREGLGLFHELCKSGGVLYGDVCQNLAVKRHARGFQSVDKLTVSDAVQPGGRADALNPQPAVLPLLHAALALGQEEALSPPEILLTPGPAFCAAFYAWHGFAPSSFRETRRVAAKRCEALHATGLLPVGFVGRANPATISASLEDQRCDPALRDLTAGRHPCSAAWHVAAERSLRKFERSG